LDYMEDVPPDLATEGRFEEDIMLAVPNADERLEILKSMDVPLPEDVREQHLSELARRAHAYNPRDLKKLVRKATRLAVARLDTTTTASLEPSSSLTISLADLEDALPKTRPSTMAGINLKPPVVRWDDIGGQDDVKRALKRMVRLTTTVASDPALRSLVVTLPKGMLLYGPPGCSKTLSAQAFATESGFNFFSVKGAELLNMYVGESERAMRNLFSRAAAASPSIIFFDEIDSIAGQRGPSGGAGGGNGGGAGAGSGASRTQSAVNLITTLLTEMDGFETLTGVFVLAATNRPEAMDPALLRPGRFDQVVYVGPPDLATREAVFRVHLRRCALADDVDFAELARTTDGHSGANIKHICAEAGLAVLHRVMEEEAPHASIIAMADLLEAIERTPRLITNEMVEGYERWQKRFRPCK
jgi:AAA family ATPase